MNSEKSVVAFLWYNRARAPFLSGPWLKMLLKRFFYAPRLFAQVVRFALLRAKGAVIAPSVVLSGARIEGNAGNLSIGQFSGVGRAVLQCHERLSIGESVVINDGVKILTGSHDINSSDYSHVFEPVEIEDFVWVATDAIILQGVTLGRGCVVAAGAVVAKSVAPYDVVAGNPARVKGHRKQIDFHYTPSTWHALNEAWLGRNFVASAKCAARQTL